MAEGGPIYDRVEELLTVPGAFAAAVAAALSRQLQTAEGADYPEWVKSVEARYVRGGSYSASYTHTTTQYRAQLEWGMVTMTRSEGRYGAKSYTFTVHGNAADTPLDTLPEGQTALHVGLFEQIEAASTKQRLRAARGILREVGGAGL